MSRLAEAWSHVLVSALEATLPHGPPLTRSAQRAWSTFIPPNS